MSGKKQIDEWALDYWLLQQYAKFCFRIYFRKIEVINRQNIPEKRPLILAPNHQNALMDAMVLVCNTSFQNVFLARADIFKGKRLIRFLTYLNIMPIYRMRDGIENVKKNDKVFEKTIRVLHNRNNPLCLFPEGNHGNKRRLRPLVKGLFRIALQAQEQFDREPAVKILPVGIDYGHYRHFRTTLFVNIGEPIEVADFMAAYHDSPVLAVNQLKDRFALALSKQMIDIQSEEYYDLYMLLRVIFNQEMRKILGIQENTLAARFRADKIMIDRLNRTLETDPEEIRQLDLQVKQYEQGLLKAGLRDWTVAGERQSTGLLVIFALAAALTLPVFLFGLINNVIPYHFTAGRTKNIKDTQFHSSFKYVTGMIAFPVWYLVIAVVLALSHLSSLQILSYILLLPLTGLFAFHYYIGLKKLSASWRFRLQRNTAALTSLVNLRRAILDLTRNVVNQ